MKKVFLLVFALTFVPFVSYAQVGDIDPNETQCVELKNNLRLRDRDLQKNGEVSLLQDFLQEKGYLNSEATGFFGQMTLKAVQGYQRAQGLNPTGFVGELTRGKIKSESGCNSVTTSSMYPVGCTSLQGYSSVTGNACNGTTPSVQFQAPTVDLKVNNADGPLTKSSGYSTFTWNSTNADYCTASGDTYWSGSKPISGSESIWTGNEKTGITTYRLTCGASSGKVSPSSDNVTISFVSSGTTSSVYPAGCTSLQGFSSVTGNACNGTTPIVNPRQTIQVVSPNGGQTYINGGYGVPTNLSTVIDIEYKSFGIVGQNLVVYLYHPVFGNVRSQSVIASNSGTIQMDLARGDTLVQPGEYKITLCAPNITVPATGKPLCDSSDDYFKVVGETVASPNITIQNLEPVWYPYTNPTYDIRWTLSGDTSSYTHRYVQFVGGGTRYIMAKDFINENSVSLMAPRGQAVDIDGRVLPAEVEYSVVVCAYSLNNPQKNICDTKGPVKISYKG
jgi:hypothetical protein